MQTKYDIVNKVRLINQSRQAKLRERDACVICKLIVACHQCVLSYSINAAIFISPVQKHSITTGLITLFSEQKLKKECIEKNQYEKRYKRHQDSLCIV